MARDVVVRYMDLKKACSCWLTGKEEPPGFVFVNRLRKPTFKNDTVTRTTSHFVGCVGVSTRPSSPTVLPRAGRKHHGADSR